MYSDRVTKLNLWQDEPPARFFLARGWELRVVTSSLMQHYFIDSLSENVG